MHSCLSTDPVLHRIISKLYLSAKFGVQGVCRQWKNIAIRYLQHHEYLVIREDHFTFLWSFFDCDEHVSLRRNDNSIRVKHIDLKFLQRILSLLQGVKYVYIDVSSTTLSRNNKAILRLLINSCGQSLECLCIPFYNDLNDKTFPLTDSLPHLKHMLLNHTTSQVTKNILTACPNLEYLESSTSFTDWQMLPKGFKKLYSDPSEVGFDGINNLLSSPAAQSLEVVRKFVMTGETYYQSYHLSCLKQFEVTIDSFVTNCLTHLARILSFAPVLRELIITVRAFDEIEPQVWINVLSSCQNLTKLTVYLDEPFGIVNLLINVSSWQDDFAKTIVSMMKKLEYLHISFHLSSDGLRLLSQLENLRYFHHEIHTENILSASVFDTNTWTDFLSSSFDKKLTEYHIQIPFGEYLIVQQSFYEFIYKMERKHFLRFHMSQNSDYGNERVHPYKVRGKIYVTKLDVYEWDLMRPYF